MKINKRKGWIRIAMVAGIIFMSFFLAHYFDLHVYKTEIFNLLLRP